MNKTKIGIFLYLAAGVRCMLFLRREEIEQ